MDDLTKFSTPISIYVADEPFKTIVDVEHHIHYLKLDAYINNVCGFNEYNDPEINYFFRSDMAQHYPEHRGQIFFQSPSVLFIVSPYISDAEYSRYLGWLDKILNKDVVKYNEITEVILNMLCALEVIPPGTYRVFLD